jgi:riboflavin kinase / FMN adenylyltransferase
MIVHTGYDNLRLNSPVVTMGIFDGVHRGHKALLDLVIKNAIDSRSESAVVTFSPHPKMVLNDKKENVLLLTTMEEKLSLLSVSGIDHLIILEFTKEFSCMRAYDFIKNILVGKIGARHLVIGYNHRFGAGCEGDYYSIRKFSDSLGLKVEQVKQYAGNEGVISSSAIREALLKGDVIKANEWLGYTYTISGTVVEGKKLGRRLGYPTANLNPDDGNKLIPVNGVYAVEVLSGGIKYIGLLSIGTNPTVNTDTKTRSIEVFILNFDKDIYGDKLTIFFRKKLRDEKKFDSLEQLINQIEIDRQHLLTLFS